MAKMTVRASKTVASITTSIDPKASRQRILCYQRIRISFPLILTYRLSYFYFKTVTDTPDSGAISLLRIRFAFFAQLADVDIYRMLIAQVILAPYLIHQYFA